MLIDVYKRQSFNYVKQDIADVKKRYISLGFHLHEMEPVSYTHLKYSAISYLE